MQKPKKKQKKLKKTTLSILPNQFYNAPYILIFILQYIVLK